MYPTVLSHFPNRCIYPRETSFTISKCFAHHFSFGTRSPSNFSTNSVAFDSSEIIHLKYWVNSALGTCIKYLQWMQHNKRIRDITADHGRWRQFVRRPRWRPHTTVSGQIMHQSSNMLTVQLSLVPNRYLKILNFGLFCVQKKNQKCGKILEKKWTRKCSKWILFRMFWTHSCIGAVIVISRLI